MEKHNFAAYKPGTFATDISNLELDERFFIKEDMPAFVHEYCHFIQDITTISGIFGFSLLMRDIVALTQKFSDGEGKTISIPLERDEYGETINKFRKYYSMYCGDPDEVRDIDYTACESIQRRLEINNIDLDGQKRKLAVNHIQLKGLNHTVHFGLVALQEIHAYYAQLLAETKLPDVEFNVPADSLSSFPYKFGDFLFEQYNIKIDLPSKFVLIDLCLDTIQAPSVFLDVLETLKGKEVTYFGKNRTDLIELVEEVRTKSSHSTEDALDQILPDLKQWSNDPSRKYLSQALTWYVKQVELVYSLKELTSKTFFSLAFTMDWYNFSLLFKCFPSPAYLNNGTFYRNFPSSDQEADEEFEKAFEAATTIWSHKILYDLLCSENKEQLSKRCDCPLFENCHIRAQIGDKYTCKMAPWEIIKNENEIKCQYGMAAHSFGLWQNRLDIKW